jgi:hypothetical protein
MALHRSPVVAAREAGVGGATERPDAVRDGVLRHAQGAGDLGVIEALGNKLRNAFLRVDMTPRHDEHVFA